MLSKYLILSSTYSKLENYFLKAKFKKDGEKALQAKRMPIQVENQFSHSCSTIKVKNAFFNHERQLLVCQKQQIPLKIKMKKTLVKMLALSQEKMKRFSTSKKPFPFLCCQGIQFLAGNYGFYLLKGEAKQTLSVSIHTSINYFCSFHI